MGTTLIIGMGKSGLASAKKLKEHGYSVLVYDKNACALAEKPEWASFFADGQHRILDDHWSSKDLDGVEEAIISPGIPTDIPLVEAIKGRQIPLIGEIELGARFIRASMVGITGTNGKTTTTTLIYEIFKLSGASVYLAGNIGYPLMDLADITNEKDVVVVELSSFQLESIRSFHVKLGMVLNITPDHLDRHHTMDAYVDAKRNIFKNSAEQDYALLNLDDPVTAEMAKDLTCRVLYFSINAPVDNGAYLDKGRILLARDGQMVELMGVNELNIPGLHNVKNVLAAAAATYFMGVSPESIRQGVQGFAGVEHRIEFVRNLHGVTYYNDSKGTNTDAGIIALEAMDRPVVLIAGGYDKKADYEEWIQCFFGKVKKGFLIGETANTIYEKAVKMGYNDLEICKTLEEAVHKSAVVAQDGDVVLLSPACASWDMFDNYEARGTQYKELVHKL
jgi:UDP-N-acetylmuramoylalanine--D-glutamate ligase